MFRLFLAAALLAFAGAAHAEGALQRRLHLEIDLLREAGFSGVERGQARLAQKLDLQVVLASDGTRMPNNPLDPDDSRRQFERGQRIQRKVQAALEASGRAPAPSDPPSLQAMQVAMQAQAQSMQARCGQDRDCLMREAMAMSASISATTNAPGIAPNSATQDAASTSGKSKGGHPRPAGDDDDADEPEEAPYLMFTGASDCRLDAATTIDERIEGSFDDVQGVVPFTATTKAAGRERDAVVCPLVQAVLDTRDGRLWSRVLPVLRGVPGTRVRSEQGRTPQRSDAAVLPRWHEGDAWLNERLSRLGAQGSDQLERPLPGGRLVLRVSWRFAPA